MIVAVVVAVAVVVVVTVTVAVIVTVTALLVSCHVTRRTLYQRSCLIQRDETQR